jgi:hypothetical protein
MQELDYSKRDKRDLTVTEEKEVALKVLLLKYQDSVRLYNGAKARRDALGTAVMELGGTIPE